jgi:hypothetical protein
VTITPENRRLAIQVARALDNPDTWCRCNLAQDGEGRAISWNDPAAARWCAYGHALRLGGVDAADDLEIVYRMMFASGSLVNDNDRRERGREYVRDRLLELAIR